MPEIYDTTVTIDGVTYSKNNFTGLAENNGLNFAVNDFLHQWYNNSGVIRIKTSGSTGEPKTIALKKTAMLQSALRTCSFFGLNRQSSVLLCLSAEYIAGKMMIVRAMVAGFNLRTIATGSASLINNKILTDFAAVVPAQIAEALLAPECFERYQTLLIGGAPVSPETELKLAGIGTRFFHSYGMTETASHVALRALNNTIDCGYKAVPDVNFSIDERQCLVISAPFITDEPIITNDIVNLLDPHHFEWIGRYDHVINSGGIKMYPEQIEARIAGLISLPFYIKPTKHTKFGTVPTLVIETGSAKINKQELLDKIAIVLTKYELPKYIEEREKFRYTKNGKILRE